MTKEEAWRRVKGYLYDVLDGDEADEIIKTLEHQTCEDAVSRAHVMLLVREFLFISSYNEETFLNDLKNLPLVQPEQRMGHWIQTEEKNDAEPCILWECSCCHKEFRSVVHKVSNYCPNCGVKMINEEK